MWPINRKELIPRVGVYVKYANRRIIKTGRVVKLEPLYSSKDTNKKFIKRKIGFGSGRSLKYTQDNFSMNYKIFILDSEFKFLAQPYLSSIISQTSPFMTDYTIKEYSLKESKIAERFYSNIKKVIKLFVKQFNKRPFTVEDFAIFIYKNIYRDITTSHANDVHIATLSDIELLPFIKNMALETLQSNWNIFDAITFDTYHIIPELDIRIRTLIKETLQNDKLVAEFISICKGYISAMQINNEETQKILKTALLDPKYSVFWKAIILYERQNNRSDFQPTMSEAINRTLIYPLELLNNNLISQLLASLDFKIEFDPFFYIGAIEGNTISDVYYATSEMSEHILEQANKIVSKHSNEDYKHIDTHYERRVDLSHIPSYAIDDIETTEVDDCFGIDPENENKVYIHIADPTTVILPNEILDLDARKRSTSVYFPGMKKSMIPSLISSDQFTLKETGMNRGLTFVATINPENGSIVEYDVYPSKFSQMKRITYEIANEMIESDLESFRDLKALYRIAMIRKNGRKGESFSLPSFKIKIKDGVIDVYQEIELKSHKLVEEMMILCGEIAAKMCFENKIDIPYRSFKSTFKNVNSLSIMDQLRSVLNANSAISSIFPLPHEAIGLDVYTRASSPIRRYTDLLVHHQIKSYLRNGKNSLPFTRTALEHILNYVDNTEKNISKLQRYIEKYYKEKYLLQYPNRNWKATILSVRQPLGVPLNVMHEYHHQRISAYIHDIGLIANINSENAPNLKVDDEVILSALNVDGNIRYIINDIKRENT